MKSPTNVIFLLAAASTIVALPVSSMLASVHSITHLAANILLLEAIYVPEESRITTAYDKSEAQLAKEAGKVGNLYFILFRVVS